MTNSTSLYAAAIQILEEEYLMLAHPGAAKLAAFVDRKEILAPKLRDANLTAGQVMKIRHLALRNQNRLSAVLRGTSSALNALREFRPGANVALHYARDGRRTTLHEAAGNLTRRA